jgi:hypothetical protein
MRRWICKCSWCGLESALLVAPHPFIKDDFVSGCPSCCEMDSLEVACQGAGCNKPASAGYQGPFGYTWSCSDHYAEYLNSKEK